MEEINGSRSSRVTKRKKIQDENPPRPVKSVKVMHKETVKSKKFVTKFLKVYKGKDDWHIPVFREVQSALNVNKVFYPGCDKHITASLVFQDVTYLDFNSTIASYYDDPGMLEWVDLNKEYASKPVIKFLLHDFQSDFGVGPNSFDLMISACAGIVSKSCSKYIKTGGYLLVSDAHYDARQAFVDPSFQFIAVYDESKKALDFSENGMNGHFKTTMGDIITQKHVQESIDRPKNKRSFKLVREAMFYLFKKIEVTI